jgi:hypothetical protein
MPKKEKKKKVIVLDLLHTDRWTGMQKPIGDFLKMFVVNA